jgi:alpha-tubulin suppressor-like RCC1 family protein
MYRQLGRLIGTLLIAIGIVAGSAGLAAPLAVAAPAVDPVRRAPTTAAVISKIATAGYQHTCALLSSNEVRCWGSNERGQLGDGTGVDSFLPVLVRRLGSDVRAITAGGRQTCVLLAGRTVRCWGRNDDGQLGDGTQFEDRWTPVNVSGLAGVRSVVAGGRHTCALLMAGNVRCWGSNDVGQLGDNTRVHPRLNPVDVVGLGHSVRAIVPGIWHTCAVLNNGSARCWGQNDRGQVGDGTRVTRRRPYFSVHGLDRDVRMVAAGSSHTCALLMNGTVVCWGANDRGQLGDGTTTDRLTPVPVRGLGGVSAIAAGDAHTCALLQRGVVRCWGANGDGQLGDRTTTDRQRPVAVDRLASVGAISTGAGVNHTCALLVRGELRCWGDNDYGQLGDGTITDRRSPVLVRWIR